MKKTFDNTIGRAAIRPTTQRKARPGRIRFWLKMAGVTLALLVAAHIVAADPLARARADIRVAAARSEPRAETEPPLANCVTILICEMPE